MTWMNRYDVEECVDAFLPDGGERPHLAAASVVLIRLMAWTDSNSDGWPYWQAPSKASAKLQDALTAKMRERRTGRELEDFTRAELNKLLAPVKAFLTRRGVDHDVIFGAPARAA